MGIVTKSNLVFEAEETPEGVARVGSVVFTEDDHAEMRVLIALLTDENGVTDVRLVVGPSHPAGVDNRCDLVFRGAAGTALLRLATRALRALKESKESGDE